MTGPNEWYNRGRFYHNSGNYKKAIDFYKKVLNSDPNHVKAWNEMGWAYNNLKNYEKAIECSEKALEIDKQYYDAWDNKGWAYNNLKSYEKAINCYLEALRINPRSANVFNNMGIANFYLKNYDKAIECYDKAIKLDPFFKKPWNNKGNVYDKLNQTDKAMECYEKAINIDPTYSIAWFNKGNLYHDINHFNNAIECYEKAINNDQEYFSAWYNMGNVYYDLRNYEKSIECYKKVIAINPNHSKAKNKLETIIGKLDIKPRDWYDDIKITRWTKLKRTLKKGAKILIPVAAGWAAGIVFPPAGAALYSYLKDKIDKSSVYIPLSDEKLYEICTDVIPKKSVKYLHQILREALAEIKIITPEQLEIVLGTFLRPLNESLNDIMDYIKNNTEQIPYLMEEWKAENQLLIDELHLDMNKGFDKLNIALEKESSKIIDGISQIARTLSKFEILLDNNFSIGAKQIFSLEKISSADLILISKAQMSNINNSIISPFDIPFDPELFVNRTEADNAFKDFIVHLSSPFTIKYFFLILASAGMGKTWTLTSWAYKLLEEMFDEEQTKNFIPFLIHLKLDIETQLKVLTGAPTIMIAIKSLCYARDSSNIIPILFLDGLDELRPESAKNVLNTIMDITSAKIPVIITCRDADWSREEKIFEMHSALSEKCYEHKMGTSYDIKEVSCQPTLYLETFSEKEFKKAIEKYEVPLEAFYNDQLQKMAKHPILLRLFSEFYKKKGYLPNPLYPQDFKKIFIGEKGEPIRNNILGRLEIYGKRKDYLVKLTSRFLEKGDELTTNDLEDLIESKNFRIIRSAGIIQEKWGDILTTYELNKLYKPHLEYMVELAGLAIKKNR